MQGISFGLSFLDVSKVETEDLAKVCQIYEWSIPESKLPVLRSLKSKRYYDKTNKDKCRAAHAKGKKSSKCGNWVSEWDAVCCKPILVPNPK